MLSDDWMYVARGNGNYITLSTIKLIRFETRRAQHGCNVRRQLDSFRLPQSPTIKPFPCLSCPFPLQHSLVTAHQHKNPHSRPTTQCHSTFTYLKLAPHHHSPPSVSTTFHNLQPCNTSRPPPLAFTSNPQPLFHFSLSQQWPPIPRLPNAFKQNSCP